jgi:predicted amidohydrolase YtcJ
MLEPAVSGRPMILVNGTVRTMERSSPTVPELIVDGERVASRPTSERYPEAVDLAGRCVVPGFTDSHTHFPTWSMLRRWLDLEGCDTLEATLDRVAPAAATAAPGRWLVGYGWTSDPWKATARPAREALDASTGTIPTALWSKDMHTFWLNSAGAVRTRRFLGTGADVVEVDERGEPTGILREAAAWRFREHELAVSVDEHADAVIEGIGVAHARGVTAVHDKDGWIGAPKIWDRVRERGALTHPVSQTVPNHLP